jgi:hypothetical protein
MLIGKKSNNFALDFLVWGVYILSVQLVRTPQGDRNNVLDWAVEV